MRNRVILQALILDLVGPIGIAYYVADEPGGLSLSRFKLFAAERFHLCAALQHWEAWHVEE
jgi:hypothetical protein